MHHPTHHAPLHHLGIRDAARRLGLAHTTVGRYVRAFPELNHGSEGRPRVDLDELRRHRAANLHPAPRGRQAAKLLGQGGGAATNGHAAPAPDQAGGPPTYAESKAAREAVLARKAQLDLDEKLGTLLVRSEVEEACEEAGQMLRRELLDLAPRLAEQIAVMNNKHEIAALLDTEFRALLKRVAAVLASWG